MGDAADQLSPPRRARERSSRSAEGSVLFDVLGDHQKIQKFDPKSGLMVTRNGADVTAFGVASRRVASRRVGMGWRGRPESRERRSARFLRTRESSPRGVGTSTESQKSMLPRGLCASRSRATGDIPLHIYLRTFLTRSKHLDPPCVLWLARGLRPGQFLAADQPIEGRRRRPNVHLRRRIAVSRPRARARC
jgi:hypothetical protein